jgi:hypothetical protein
MNIEDVMVAVADQLNIDESFFDSPESQNHLLSILLRDRKLQALASRCAPHELGDSIELRVCIQRAAMQLLCDLVACRRGLRQFHCALWLPRGVGDAAGFLKVGAPVLSYAVKGKACLTQF